MENKIYQFNDRGVCVNPDRIEWRDKSNADRWCVSTAEHNGFWFYSTSYWAADRGGSYGVNRNHKLFFKSQLDATVAGVRELFDRITKVPGVSSRLVNSVRERYSTLLQTNMF